MIPICTICNSGASITAVHDSQFETDYFYCGNCGFIFMEEAKILSPHQEKERYLKHINSLEDHGYVRMLETFIQQSITPFHSEIRTALDFGSGPGPVLAQLLADKNIDTDIHDIYFAPEKVYTGKQYDLITCTEVLEHIREPMPVLELLTRLLNPGGILAVMTHFHPIDGENGRQAFNQWWYRRDATHISFFNLACFDYIAAKLNLTRLMTNYKNTISFKKAVP